MLERVLAMSAPEDFRRLFTHGAVSLVAMWAYLATAAGLLAWLWIRQRAADRSNDNNERFQ